MKTLLMIVLGFGLLTSARAEYSDDHADVLLRGTSAIARSTKTLTADLEMSWQIPGQRLKKNQGSIRLMKPNYALITLTGDFPLQTLASDGAIVFTVSDATKYTQTGADPFGKNIDSPWWGLPFRYFFTQSINPYGPEPDQTARTRYVGEEVLDGESFQVVEVSGQQPMPYSARFYFGVDNLLHGTTVNFGQEPNLSFFKARISNLHVDKLLTPGDFAYSPPTTAKLEGELSTKLLALGERAPEFTLSTPEGARLSLNDLRKGRKATLINFWYLSCPPCRKEFPIFQRIYEELKNKGFNLVAIDQGDTAADVKHYVEQAKLTFPVVIGGNEEFKSSVFGQYAVATFPVTYLLDQDGKIVYRAAGIDEAGLRQALERLGLK